MSSRPLRVAVGLRGLAENVADLVPGDGAVIRPEVAGVGCPPSWRVGRSGPVWSVERRDIGPGAAWEAVADAIDKVTALSVLRAELAAWDAGRAP